MEFSQAEETRDHDLYWQFATREPDISPGIGWQQLAYTFLWLRDLGRPAMFVLREIIRDGRVEAIEWLKSHDHQCNEIDMMAAASCGYLDAVQYLRESGCPWDKWVMYHAVYNKNFDLVRWLRTNDCPWDDETLPDAQDEETKEILAWLAERA